MMTSIAERYGPVILVTLLVGVPLGALAVALLVRARVRSGWSRSWALRASISEIGMLVGTAPWLWMILTPSGGAGGLQLVPLRDLLDVLRGGDTLVQLVGNLLAFAAVGFFLPIRLRLARARWVPAVVVLVAAGLSVMVETLQFVLQVGRVSSIDDVLINALGAALASLLSIRWWRSRPDETAEKEPFPQVVDRS
ncbi:VanZ family protein [Microcella humidisoli]|uniref:VanZ family protein n=1 Tax=Microcella humidisoli TaxID=2963406 RepID=A0ABY5FUG8_9MICO|nr:VanZ family protein [Microcella humidisoli]UTT61535.1 VanZ family protein [Microcella humidisoli]